MLVFSTQFFMGEEMNVRSRRIYPNVERNPIVLVPVDFQGFRMTHGQAGLT
jgi:hypothetical protein